MPFIASHLSIESLPHELLHYTLEFVGAKELCRVAEVSHEFLSLLQQPSQSESLLWRTLATRLWIRQNRLNVEMVEVKEEDAEVETKEDMEEKKQSEDEADEKEAAEEEDDEYQPIATSSFTSAAITSSHSLPIPLLSPYLHPSIGYRELLYYTTSYPTSIDTSSSTLFSTRENDIHQMIPLREWRVQDYLQRRSAALEKPLKSLERKRERREAAVARDPAAAGAEMATEEAVAAGSVTTGSTAEVNTNARIFAAAAMEDEEENYNEPAEDETAQARINLDDHAEDDENFEFDGEVDEDDSDRDSTETADEEDYGGPYIDSDNDEEAAASVWQTYPTSFYEMPHSLLRHCHSPAAFNERVQEEFKERLEREWKKLNRKKGKTIQPVAISPVKGQKQQEAAKARKQKKQKEGNDDAAAATAASSSNTATATAAAAPTESKTNDAEDEAEEDADEIPNFESMAEVRRFLQEVAGRSPAQRRAIEMAERGDAGDMDSLPDDEEGDEDYQDDQGVMVWEEDDEDDTSSSDLSIASNPEFDFREPDLETEQRELLQKLFAKCWKTYEEECPVVEEKEEVAVESKKKKGKHQKQAKQPQQKPRTKQDALHFFSTSPSCAILINTIRTDLLKRREFLSRRDEWFYSRALRKSQHSIGLLGEDDPHLNDLEHAFPHLTRFVYSGTVQNEDRCVRGDKSFPTRIQGRVPFTSIVWVKRSEYETMKREAEEEREKEKNGKTTAASASSASLTSSPLKRKYEASSDEQKDSMTDEEVPSTAVVENKKQKLSESASVTAASSSSSLDSIPSQLTAALPTTSSSHFDHNDTSDHALSLYVPVVRLSMLAYFEIHIEAESAASRALRLAQEATNGMAWDEQNNCISIGWGTEKFRIIRRQPGWDEHSFGYHSDDGCVYHGSGSNSQRYTAEGFGPGDIVGCALDMRRSEIFFTKNGKHMGVAFGGRIQDAFYPIVGIDSLWRVTINFGQLPFAFDVMRWEKQLTKKFPLKERVNQYAIPKETVDLPAATSSIPAAASSSTSSSSSSSSASASNVLSRLHTDYRLLRESQAWPRNHIVTRAATAD